MLRLGMTEAETKGDVNLCGGPHSAENKTALLGHILLWTWARLLEKQFNHSSHKSATGKRVMIKRQR